ncbi:MAG: choice-of-anchor D domain-containing protein [Candidatus Sumerlaeaceae bacterium]
MLLMLHGAAGAQDIQVCTSSNINVGDGDTSSEYQLTKFGTVLVGQSRIRTFVLRNTDPVTTLVINNLYVFDPTDFGVDLTFTALSVPPDSQTSFDIAFHPQSAGLLIAFVLIESNDPGSESVYAIEVSGEGQAAPPLPAQPNLDVRLSRPAKFKLNKRTGLVDAKMKVDLLNVGNADSTTPTITVIGSNSEVLRVVGKSNSVIGVQYLVKPLAAATATRVKKKKVNVKLTGLENTNTYFWILADSTGAGDMDYSDNVTIDGFLTLTP